MVQTVAVGTDGSGTADKAVEFALELAARYEARIVFISVYVPGLVSPVSILLSRTYTSTDAYGGRMRRCHIPHP